jgi:hypothetical protein
VEILYGGSSKLGVGRGVTTPQCKESSLLRNFTQDLGLAGSGEHGNERSGCIKSREFLD